MYHSNWKGNHYQAGFQYGSMLLHQHMDTSYLKRGEQCVVFAKRCIPIYQKFYPEILQEIKGFSDGLQVDWKEIASFLFSMYSFVFDNRCSCFAFGNNGKTILAKNSDFSIFAENVCDSVYYCMDNGYRFVGNTTAWTEMEDGVNEYGLAVALTFVYPTKIAYGFNAGMLVRYLLEKCKTTKEAVQALQKLPISSAQTITLADKSGKIALVECNCECIKVITNDSDLKNMENVEYSDKNFVFTTNHFVSDSMCVYQYSGEDDCYSHRRYQTLCNAFQNEIGDSLQFAKDLLSGKKGFLCQYDRQKGMDTIWSSIYDVTDNKIYRAEGNPAVKEFVEDKRLQ